MTTITSRLTIRTAMEILLAFAVALSLVGYFLLPTGKANNLPTYMLGILTIMLTLSWVHVMWRSWVLVSSVLLAAYLALSLLWSKPLYDEEVHSLIGNGLLSALFIMALVICLVRFTHFQVWLIEAIVLAACLSGAGYLITAIFLDETVTEATIGRWLSPSVGAIGFGFAAVLAINLTLGRINRRFKVFWACASTLLVIACVHMNIDYVSFALLASVTALSLGRLWRVRDFGRALIWIGLCFILIVVSILVLNLVIESGRQMIWTSVLDLIYDERIAFGYGIRSQPEFHVDCGLELVAAAVDCAWRHPHNLYVSTMFYGGIVGIGALILLMISSISVTLESHHPSRWLTLSLLTLSLIHI